MQTNETIQATEYYGNYNYNIFQIVMPDRNNKFPWETGYVEFIRTGNGQELKFNKPDSFDFERINA